MFFCESSTDRDKAGRVIVLNSLTRRTEAMAEFKRVYQNFPKSKYHINAGFKLGELLVAGGGHVDAIAQFKKLLTEKPPADIAAASRYMLGNSFSILKKPTDAELAFRQLTEMHPKSGFASAAFLALGNIAANKDGQASTAANYYQSAAKSPSSPRIGAEAWFQLAELHLRSRAYEKSADAYDKLFALYPRDERVADAQLQSVWALPRPRSQGEGLRTQRRRRGTKRLWRKRSGLHKLGNR